MPPLSTDYPALSDLDRLQALSEQYARYNRSAGGLSSVIGGLLCLLMFVAALTLELSQPARLLVAAAPLFWLASKELLRRYYYQRAGAALDRLSKSQHRQHYALTAFVAAVSLIIIALACWKFGLLGLLELPWPKLGYFMVVALMPVVVWRWLWSSSDFIVGVSMICQAALIVAGRHYQLDLLGAYLIFAGLFSLLLGIKEHRDYLQLRRDMRQHAQNLS